MVGGLSFNENLSRTNSYSGTLGVCLAFGFAVAFGVYASAGVSGGHINPAVTMAMFTLGKLGILLKKERECK